MVTARGAGIAMASQNQRIALFGNPALCLSGSMTWLPVATPQTARRSDRRKQEGPCVLKSRIRHDRPSMSI